MFLIERPQLLPFIVAALAFSILTCYYVFTLQSFHAHSQTLEITIEDLRQSAAKSRRPSSIADHANGINSNIIDTESARVSPTINKDLYGTPNRDLIIFAYSENPDSLLNLAFFRKHALHAKADFIFLFNGNHTVDLSAFSALPNVRVIERENRCFDLGSYHEVLTQNSTLTTAYDRFILMNSSVRGPLFPAWANDLCWSDVFWKMLSDRTKMVGLTYNCGRGESWPAHVQSMLYAVSRETLVDVLLPNMRCYADYMDTVQNGEMQASNWVLAAGGDVYAMEGRFAAHAGRLDGNFSSTFLEWCENTDDVRSGQEIVVSGKYEGGTIHPYETM